MMPSHHSTIRRHTPLTAVLLSLALPLASCSPTASGDHAISVENCGGTVTLDHAPERITLLRSASVPTLSHLGVLSHVTHRAGKYPEGYFDAATNSILASIPSLTDKTDTSGHLQISREDVVASAPDLVLGSTDTANRSTLRNSGIPLIEEPAFCDSLNRTVTWDDVWDQIRLYGTVFAKDAGAQHYITELQHRVAAVEEATTPRKPDGGPYRIAVLYPTIGGGVTYAYGLRSMSTPVVASVGAENVYGDQDDRVFEVSAEDIVDRNPDIILALYSDGEAGRITRAINQLPGINRTTAGRTGQILPMLLNHAEPPTPLAVDGLETLDHYLRGLASTQ